MNPVHLARAMRLHGWRYQRRTRGMATFGIRFNNGRGVTKVLHLGMLQSLDMPPPALATFLTHDAAVSAQFDMRRATA